MYAPPSLKLANLNLDTTTLFTYNPSSQIVQETRSNDAYAYAGLYSVNRSYTPVRRSEKLTPCRI